MSLQISEDGKPVITQEMMRDVHRIANRPMIRSRKNPLDKCTIFSILNKEIDEIKHTIEPGRFIIKPGTPESPSRLVVGASSWWRDFDPEQPMIEIPVSSIQIAESVVKDYSNGMLGCDMASAMPGLFFAPGDVSIVELKMKYKEALKQAIERQNNWFTILIRLGDALWARTNGNPLVVSDEMRLAARSLGADKPWLKDFQLVTMIKCFACGTLKSPEYPVCPACRAIDPEHPKAKDIKFAAQ